MSGAARVFIVDDDPLHLLILDGILRAAGYTTELFEQPEALLTRVNPQEHGCIVMDLQMPGYSGLELQKVLADRGVNLPVVFVSGSADIPDAVAAMKQGALDFLTKPVQPAALLAMVAQAVKQDAHNAVERAERTRARARWENLSARERDVCLLFAKGLVVKQIAAALGIHESTAHSHRVRGMQKLAMETVAELIELLRLADEPGAPIS